MIFNGNVPTENSLEWLDAWTSKTMTNRAQNVAQMINDWALQGHLSELRTLKVRKIKDYGVSNDDFRMIAHRSGLVWDCTWPDMF